MLYCEGSSASTERHGRKKQADTAGAAAAAVRLREAPKLRPNWRIRPGAHENVRSLGTWNGRRCTTQARATVHDGQRDWAQLQRLLSRPKAGAGEKLDSLSRAADATVTPREYKKREDSRKAASCDRRTPPRETQENEALRRAAGRRRVSATFGADDALPRRLGVRNGLTYNRQGRDLRSARRRTASISRPAALCTRCLPCCGSRWRAWPPKVGCG